MSDRVAVRCILSRRVADDIYLAGEEYEMEAQRAARYPAFFEVLPAPKPPLVLAEPASDLKSDLDEKDQGSGEDKRRAPKPENKRK